MSEREQLEGILSGSEYTAYHRHDGGFSLWNWLLDKLKQFLGWLLPDLNPGESALNIVAVLLVLLLAGFLTGVIVLLTRRFRGAGRLRSHSGDWIGVGEASRSWSHYWTLAQRHEELGAWRDGIRAVFLALLFYLEERELLRVEPWKTNREYAEELADRRSGVETGFRLAAAEFERSWYGGAEVSGEQLAAFRAQAELFMQEAGEGH